MKHILDSVHGNIMIEDDFFKIIDTPEFQRLRRIEQTSIRSVFPSARHDRFIHSLGVYHIGCMIVEHLDCVEESNEWKVEPKKLKSIFKSYKIACLLHDVGHAPFSHTFENYYGSKLELSQKLKRLIQSQAFSTDIELHKENTSPHEYVSAYVAYKVFENTIRELDGDPEFVVRMIIGCFYDDKNVSNHQLMNCFISLLHGDLVDADRLDYACRDIWASGYSTSSIDLKRLINALHICYNESGDLVVCFYSNVVNEIDNLMTIKDFQNRFVINHHTVTYDQLLLQHAMEHTAKNMFLNEDNRGVQEEFAIKSMKRICSIDCMIEATMINNYKLYNPSDDDFIALMKQDETNVYFKEWISRQYKYFPIWKSPEEFAGYFGIKKGIDLKNSQFIDKIKSALSKLGISDNDIIVKDVKYKPKVKLSSLYVLINDEVKRFTDIYNEDDKMCTDQVFYYLYINKSCVGNKKIDDFRKNIVCNLQTIIGQLYPKKSNGTSKRLISFLYDKICKNKLLMRL